MTTIDELLALREKARSGDPAAVDAYQRALDGLLPSVTPDVPLLMLPVRLETRYRPLRADGSRHLMIRIYPDDVHEDSHEPGLTADERVAGTTFWTVARYSAHAASVLAAPTPPTIFGILRVVNCAFPGSTRSGENARKKSSSALSPVFSSIG